MVTLTRPTKENQPGGGIQTGGVAKVSTGGSWLQAHLALVAVLGVLLLAGLGGGGYVLLSSGGDEDPGAAPARMAAPRTTAGATPGSSASASPTGTPTASETTGRNPFDWLGGTGSTTGGTPGPSTTATGPADPTDVTVPPLVMPTVTATTRVTATRTATTTATATSGSVYLGLYGWTAEGLPMFRVNDASYTPSPGATFASSFVYISSYADGTATCANVSYEAVPENICEGEVLKLP